MTTIDDFLPIPDAPNYEINSEFICRNRKTGYVLKPQKLNGKSYYTVYSVDRQRLKRLPTFLRRLAVGSREDFYEPIPSTNFRYEINKCGKVRNARTKKVIQERRNRRAVLLRYDGGKQVVRSISNLLWEVYGKVPKRLFKPCPCSAENKHGKHFFPSLTACARFLAPEIFLSAIWSHQRLCNREPTIDEWKITYINETLDDVKWRSSSLSAIAKRQAKLDVQVGLSL